LPTSNKGIEAIFEIGRRLKHVKENDLAHGEWANWLEEIGMSRGQAHKFISVFDRFGNVSPVKQLPTVMSVLYELTSFTDEQLEQEYEFPSGEKKKPTEMSRRQIEELKRQLKQAEQQADAERKERERLEEENVKLANKPPEIRYETKTEYIEVDNTPKDYESVKARLEAYRTKFGDIENYDEHITATHRQDMLVSVMSFSRGVREFIKRYDYMTKYKSVIDSLDEESRQQYDEAVKALKGLAEVFEYTKQGNAVINAEYSEII